MITPPIAAGSTWQDSVNPEKSDIRSWGGWVESNVFSGAVSVRTSNYTVIATDRTDLQRCTSALTLSITSAATLGNGFSFYVQADGGDVVIDPDGSETVNGSATVTVPDGKFMTIYCNGSGFFGSFSDSVILDAAAQRTALGFGSNYIVQVVRAETNALTTIVETPFPLDDTIPQNTEGTELLTLSITPTSASNKLRIRAVVYAGKSTGTDMMAGLFQDSTSGALAAIVQDAQSGFRPNRVVLDHYMTAGTTSETTFKLRVGSIATLYINGTNSARLFGGVMVSSLTIEEIKA